MVGIISNSPCPNHGRSLALELGSCRPTPHGQPTGYEFHDSSASGYSTYSFGIVQFWKMIPETLGSIWSVQLHHFSPKPECWFRVIFLVLWVSFPLIFGRLLFLKSCYFTNACSYLHFHLGFTWNDDLLLSCLFFVIGCTHKMLIQIKSTF